MRSSLILVAALLVACTASEPKVKASEEKPVVQPVVRFVDRSLPKTTLDGAPVAQQAAVVEALLRVRPDRRFLLAIGDIHELLTGKRVDPEIAFENGAWTITAGGRNVGTLRELATFSEGIELLTRLAKTLGAKKPRTPFDASAFYASPLFEAAKNAEPAALAEAAAWINYQTIDRAGLADPLRARGVALFAMARAAGVETGDAFPLLAISLGYDSEGGAPKNAGAAAKQWMATRDELHAAEWDARSALLEKAPLRALPLFSGYVPMHDAIGVARGVATFIADDVANDRHALGLSAQEVIELSSGTTMAQALSRFERALEPRANALASRAFPADVIRSHYEAMFHSVLYDDWVTYAERFGDRPRAERAVNELAPITPAGTQVRDWLRLANAARYERGGSTTPQQAIARIPLLGAASRAWLLRAYSDSLGAHDRNVRRAVYALFPQLDTRSGDLYEAGMLAHLVLSDPLRRERYLGTAIERSPAVADRGTRAWYFSLLGDAARLRALAKEGDPADRANALNALSELPNADHRAITAEFEKLVQQSNYLVYSGFARYLNERRDWKTKERVARAWMERYAESSESPIQVAYYAASLADALEQQRRYDEAWAVIEPHVRVWSANVISGAISLLERKGQVDRALDLGKQYIERYPGASSRTDVAKVYWRRGRYDEAADLFAARQRLDSYGLRTDVPEAFVETFRDGDRAAAAEAIAALAKEGVEPWVVTDILRSARLAGQHELAFALAEKLNALPELHAGTPLGAGVAIEAWRALRETKGVDAANAWLASHVSDAAALQFVSSAYQDGLPELVLAYATPRPSQLKSIEMLAFIAAALTHAKVPHDDPRRVALVERVRALGDQPKSLLGVAQYLLGLIDEEAFTRWPYEPAGRAVVAYFIGLKAWSEGNADKALPWMLAAREGADSNPPAVWAGEMLARWSEAKRPWPAAAN